MKKIGLVISGICIAVEIGRMMVPARVAHTTPRVIKKKSFKGVRSGHGALSMGFDQHHSRVARYDYIERFILEIVRTLVSERGVLDQALSVFIVRYHFHLQSHV